jgi:hypothetical protein
VSSSVVDRYIANTFWPVRVAIDQGPYRFVGGKAMNGG